MDTSETYIKMCDQAVKQTDIGEKWKSLPQKMRLGTFICFRSVIGMVVNKEYGKPKNDLFYLIPETLAFRVWCDIESEDVKVIETNKNFSDEGFPLFRQDQIQEMMFGKDVGVQTISMDISSFSITQAGTSISIQGTMEQLWLAFYMHERHQMKWLPEKQKWIKI